MFDPSHTRLLLVESEPLLADLTSFRLELLGFQIDSVTSLAAALTQLKEAAPDLLIMGTQAQGGDIFEWIGELRKRDDLAAFPILACSTNPSIASVERAFAAGAQDYLIVPFDPSVLEEKIQNLLTYHGDRKARSKDHRQEDRGQGAAT